MIHHDRGLPQSHVDVVWTASFQFRMAGVTNAKKVLFLPFYGPFGLHERSKRITLEHTLLT
jgi:hypothetical protein